jgi:hypothetical protein
VALKKLGVTPSSKKINATFGSQIFAAKNLSVDAVCLENIHWGR